MGQGITGSAWSSNNEVPRVLGCWTVIIWNHLRISHWANIQSEWIFFCAVWIHVLVEVIFSQSSICGLTLVSSAGKPDVITYPAYTKDQILTVLTQRLKVFSFVHLCRPYSLSPDSRSGQNFLPLHVQRLKRLHLPEKVTCGIGVVLEYPLSSI